MASLFSKITGRKGENEVTSLLDLLGGKRRKKAEESPKVKNMSKWQELLNLLQGDETDPSTGEISGRESLSPMAQYGMGQSQGGSASAPGPAVGIMGPPPIASTQFTDVSRQGLMSPRTGQGPRPMQQGMQAGMQQMPGPRAGGLSGLMNMASQSKPPQQEQRQMPEIQMNEYLRGLLYG